MDHAVGVTSRPLENVDVSHVTRDRLGAQLPDELGGPIGPGETQGLMTCGDEFRDDG